MVEKVQIFIVQSLDISYESKDVFVGTKQVTVREAYDETVVVRQAYDETVTTGYKCSCGAVK